MMLPHHLVLRLTGSSALHHSTGGRTRSIFCGQTKPIEAALNHYFSLLLVPGEVVKQQNNLDDMSFNEDTVFKCE